MCQNEAFWQTLTPQSEEEVAPADDSEPHAACLHFHLFSRSPFSGTLF